MNGSFKVIPSVFAALVKDGHVLLLRRQNTGFMDGYYDFPSGHLEPGEPIPAGAARELLEEAGVSVKPQDLQLFHVHVSDQGDRSYIGMMFRAVKWTGEPQLKEKDKSDDIGWFPLDNLPSSSILITEALKNINGQTVSFRSFSAKELEKFSSGQ